jgi:hypothetical protein
MINTTTLYQTMTTSKWTNPCKFNRHYKKLLRTASLCDNSSSKAMVQKRPASTITYLHSHLLSFPIVRVKMSDTAVPRKTSF